MDKLVLSHMDMQLDDRKYHDAVLETGTWFEYDTWGNEGYINTPEYVFPRDSQRLDNLVRLIDKGYIGIATSLMGSEKLNPCGPAPNE